MSEVKVNKISPRTNCGTVQLGDSGDTITIPAGATITNNGTQTGFGRTGTVDWDTTAKTASFTAVSGNGYFVNTTSGAVTMTLPATPSAGDIVSVKDYAGTFATNNLTIARNGSNLDGSAADAVRNTDNESLTLVYVDGTQGWKSVEEGTGFIGENFMVATGGTITCCGDYKIHTFTGPGTFTVSSLASSPTNNVVDYLVVAGGGGAGGDAGGGGGGGGVRFSNGSFTNCGPSSPRNGATALPVTATGYPVTVGGGGAGAAPGNGQPNGTKGGDSVFSGSTTITSTGGGYGGGATVDNGGGPGGSGGGGRATAACGSNQGSGNTPPVTPSQGSNGGASAPTGPGGGGGGGGFMVAGAQGNGPGPGFGGLGGSGGGFPAAAFGPANGQENTATGPVAPATPDGFRYFAGGGGGGTFTGCLGIAPGNGSLGGGGTVSAYPNPGGSGLTNMGGGGTGGSADNAGGGSGGSGIVVIRYKFQ